MLHFDPLKVVAKVQVNNIASLVQVMDWNWAHDQPISEIVMASITDTYM